ncbi:MAG: hypothetical protein EOM92_09705 [Gammaproteobacteria bacterium]|nr:hypothetical protein [Gammaproteobacteria bacterium]
MMTNTRWQGLAKHRGGAAVEFVVVLAFFLIPLLVIAFDYGRVFYAAMSVTSATNALAMYVTKYHMADDADTEITDSQDKTNQALNYVLAVSPNLDSIVSNLEVLVDEDTEVADCPLGTAYQDEPAKCIRVQVSGVFTTVLDYAFVTHEIPLVRDAIIRVN